MELDYRDVRVAVVGDAIIDRYLTGTTDRKNPEGPFPLILINASAEIMGGAFNVVRTMATLGAEASFFGCDERSQLPVKTRLFDGDHYVARFDRDKTVGLVTEKQLDTMANLAADGKLDGIVVSDYGKGSIDEYIMDELFSIANNFGNELPIIVDAYPKNYRMYNHEDVIIKMNQRELREITREDGIQPGMDKLEKTHPLVIVTVGSGGAFWLEKGGRPARVPAVRRSVYDVTGAGDVFLGVFAMEYITHRKVATAIDVANNVAGLSVEAKGSHCPTALEIKNGKIANP